MSATHHSNRTVSNTLVHKDMPETNYKANIQKKDIKECFKLLEAGELRVEDVEEWTEELMLKPHLADHIQYELHKYCQKDPSQTDGDLIMKIVEFCYEPSFVLHFKCMDRFVGCVHHISSHLLKKERFNDALDVHSKLLLKKIDIFKNAKEVILTFLHTSHSKFMASAMALAPTVSALSCPSYQILHKLAMESLNLFKLPNVEHSKSGMKVMRTSTLYLQALRCYAEEDVLEFYQTLGDVLKILLPQREPVLDQFLYYYLSRMSTLQKWDEEVLQELKRTLSLFEIFLRGPSKGMSVLEKVLNFFWTECAEEKWINGEEVTVLCESASDSELYFLLVSIVFGYGMQFWLTKFENTWCENVSVGFVEKLSKTLMALHRRQCGNPKLYCSSPKDPLEICFGDLLNGNLQKIQYIVRLCLKKKIPNALSLVPYSREAFALSMECLANMKASGCCDKHRVHLWKFSVIHHTNTVEDICRLPPSDESWHYLQECSHEILREVVNADAELPFDYTRLKILFQRWHNASLKLRNYQEALYACVVFYVFYPKAEEDVMSMWIQTKSESSNEIFQETTVGEILKTCDKNLREFSKTYNGSNDCLKSALFMELKAYSSCLPDTFLNPHASHNLATRIWKQLEKCKLDVWETSLAVSLLILASIASDSENLPNGLHEKCQELIDSFTNQGRKAGMQCRSLFHAGNLTFSLFLYDVKAAETSEGKMDTTHMVLGYLKKAEEERVKFGDDVDLNLTCDVIPSSRHLTVELETSHVQELNKIVGVWNDALRGSLEELPSDSEFEMWLRNAKQVANMFEMFGEYRSALTAWLTFYRIGKLCKNSEASLLGLSHLIGNCSDVDKSGLQEEAELVSAQLDPGTGNRHALVEYSLAMASNYLKNKKPDKCLERLIAGKKVLEGLPLTIKSYALNARFWCLVGQFLVVHTEYETVFEFPIGTDVRVVSFKAFSYANGGARSDLIKSATQSECMELVLAMLEVNLWSYNLHGVYRQTDFMRFFLDDLYQIVQRLFLPTRTAEMLARLAEVDMICEKGPDCQEKVVKVKSILTTLSPSCGEAVKFEKTPSYLTVPQSGWTENATARPISPVRFVNKCPPAKDFDLSPIHYYLASNAKAPKAEEHVKKCKCRLCQNILIQTLTVDTLRLEGDIHNLKNCSREAAACYAQACEVLNKLEIVRAEQSQTARLELASVLEADPGGLELKLAFVQFHAAKFLINYALFESFALNSVTENVSKTILRISKLMKRFSYEEKLLQWTFTELKLFCVLLNKTEDKKQQKRSTPVGTKTPTAGPSLTPVMAQNKKQSQKRPERRLIPSEEEENQLDEFNTGFIETSNSEANLKMIRPRKLNFHVYEPETITKMQKKASRERMNVSSRRLDFDASGDLFEESPAPVQTATVRKATKTTKTREDSTATVKVYTDGGPGAEGGKGGQSKEAGKGVEKSRNLGKRSTVKKMDKI